MVVKVSCVLSKTLDILKALIPVYVSLPFLTAPYVIAVIRMFALNVILELFASLKEFPVIALVGWNRAL